MEIAHKQANVFSQKILPYHYSMMEVRVILQSKIKIYRISICLMMFITGWIGGNWLVSIIWGTFCGRSGGILGILFRFGSGIRTGFGNEGICRGGGDR